MKKQKTPVSYRLAAETIRDIKAIASVEKCSEADVISVLVHCYNSGHYDDQVENWFEIVRRS